MLSDAHIEILRRLKQHGKPVKDFQFNFELGRNDVLCSLAVMTRLKDEGLVGKVDGRRFWLTEKGESVLLSHSLPRSIEGEGV